MHWNILPLLNIFTSSFFNDFTLWDLYMIPDRSVEGEMDLGRWSVFKQRRRRPWMCPWPSPLHLVFLNTQRQTVLKFLSENHQSVGECGPCLCLRPWLLPLRSINHLTLCPARCLQRARECRIPAPVSTLRPRVCPCGRAESSTTCELQRLWSASSAEIETEPRHDELLPFVFAGTRERIKCSRIFVSVRSVNQRCPGEVRVSWDTS